MWMRDTNFQLYGCLRSNKYNMMIKHMGLKATVQVEILTLPSY